MRPLRIPAYLSLAFLLMAGTRPENMPPASPSPSVAVSTVVTSNSSRDSRSSHRECTNCPYCAECGTAVDQNVVTGKWTGAWVTHDECEEGDACQQCDDICPLNDADMSEEFDTDQEAQEWVDENSPCLRPCGIDHLGGDGQLFAFMGDKNGLLEALRAANGALFVNVSRGAIQGYGCGDNVVIHVPISETLRQELFVALAWVTWPRLDAFKSMLAEAAGN